MILFNVRGSMALRLYRKSYFRNYPQAQARRPSLPRGFFVLISGKCQFFRKYIERSSILAIHCKAEFIKQVFPIFYNPVFPLALKFVGNLTYLLILQVLSKESIGFFYFIIFLQASACFALLVLHFGEQKLTVLHSQRVTGVSFLQQVRHLSIPSIFCLMMLAPKSETPGLSRNSKIKNSLGPSSISSNSYSSFISMTFIFFASFLAAITFISKFVSCISLITSNLFSFIAESLSKMPCHIKILFRWFLIFLMASVLGKGNQRTFILAADRNITLTVRYFTSTITLSPIFVVIRLIYVPLKTDSKQSHGSFGRSVKSTVYCLSCFIIQFMCRKVLSRSKYWLLSTSSRELMGQMAPCSNDLSHELATAQVGSPGSFIYQSFLAFSRSWLNLALTSSTLILFCLRLRSLAFSSSSATDVEFFSLISNYSSSSCSLAIAIFNSISERMMRLRKPHRSRVRSSRIAEALIVLQAMRLTCRQLLKKPRHRQDFANNSSSFRFCDGRAGQSSRMTVVNWFFMYSWLHMLIVCWRAYTSLYIWNLYTVVPILNSSQAQALFIRNLLNTDDQRKRHFNKQRDEVSNNWQILTLGFKKLTD